MCNDSEDNEKVQNFKQSSDEQRKRQEMMPWSPWSPFKNGERTGMTRMNKVTNQVLNPLRSRSTGNQKKHKMT